MAVYFGIVCCHTTSMMNRIELYAKYLNYWTKCSTGLKIDFDLPNVQTMKKTAYCLIDFASARRLISLIGKLFIEIPFEFIRNEIHLKWNMKSNMKRNIQIKISKCKAFHRLYVGCQGNVHDGFELFCLKLLEKKWIDSSNCSPKWNAFSIVKRGQLNNSEWIHLPVHV